MFDLVDFADLQDFLQFSQEQCLLHRVGEGPVFQKSFEQRDSQRPILGEEQHRAPKQLFVELGASLNLVERDDDVLEEDHVLISEWDGETGDDRSLNVQNLGSSVELMVLMDQGEEALVHGLPDHLTSRDELGVQLMKDVLQIVTLDGLFRIEELKELLDKLRSNIHFK